MKKTKQLVINELKQIIGFNLKQRREEQNLSQNELSTKSNVPQSIISDLESGKIDSSISTVYKLALTLGCKIDELIDDRK